MTRDEAHKLLGGYATGSLSETERKALFEAALEDQELFEQLADEQALKEVLDQPGARERLIAALEPSSSRAAWWMRPWPWAAAAAALAIAIGVTMIPRTQPPKEPPQEVAQVLKAPETPVPQAVPVKPPQRTATPAPRKLEKAQPPPPADALGEVRSFAAAPRAQNETVTVTRTVATYFSYDVRRDGSLQITVMQPGFLAVTASFPFPKNDADIFPATAVARSTPVRLQVPSDATGIVIGFSKTAGINDAPIQQVPASGVVTDLPEDKVRIQPTPVFLKPEPQ